RLLRDRRDGRQLPRRPGCRLAAFFAVGAAFLAGATFLVAIRLAAAAFLGGAFLTGAARFAGARLVAGRVRAGFFGAGRWPAPVPMARSLKSRILSPVTIARPEA